VIVRADRVAGIGEQERERARHFEASDGRSAAILAFARAVLDGRGEVSDQEYQAARDARLTDAQLSEIVGHVAINVLTNSSTRHSGSKSTSRSWRHTSTPRPSEDRSGTGHDWSRSPQRGSPMSERPSPIFLPPGTMRIGEIWRYPVKSMAGEQLQNAQLTPLGIPGDRLLYVLDRHDQIVSARTRPRLLAHKATLSSDGEVLVDGLDWQDSRVADAVEDAAGRGARLVVAGGPERFDILPLLIATDGAIAEFGHDRRRLRPNIVITGVPGLTERTWEWTSLKLPHATIAIADLRGRCITTTWDPDSVTQDIEVLRRIRARFDGTLALNAWPSDPGPIAVSEPVTLEQQPADAPAPLTGRFV
jgi:uncharacterized protein